MVDREFVKVLSDREQTVKWSQARVYGINAENSNYRPYHGEDPLGNGHINIVANRMVQILRTSFEAQDVTRGSRPSEKELADREELLVFAHYVGTIHDSVQRSKNVMVIPQENGPAKEEDIQGDWKDHVGEYPIKRKRETGPNEQATIDTEIEFMDQINIQRKSQGLSELFTDKHKQLLSSAILSTVPGWDVTGATVFQPNLLKLSTGVSDEAKLFNHAMAWADLKGIFTGGLQRFKDEGDLNLLEDFPDILEIALHQDEYPATVHDGVADRIRKWRADQVTFAQAQWDQLQEQLSRFPDPVSKALRKDIFKEDQFPDTLNEIKKRAEESKRDTPQELLSELQSLVDSEVQKYPMAA